MVKASLYTNSKGWGVSRHSYSGSSTWQFCPTKYKLERIVGFKEKAQRASFKFGIALEEAIRVYHECGNCEAKAVDTFMYGPTGDAQKKGWINYKDDAELEYTKTEVDWASLGRSGVEMLRLYHLRLPLFRYKIPNPLQSFQLEHKIEVYPNSSLAGIEFVAYIDMEAEFDNGEKVLIDIKTGSTDIPELIQLDPQLRSYAWAANRQNIGFLWFEKVGRGFERGTRCSLLEHAKDFKAGQQVFVIKVQEEDPENFEQDGLWIVESETIIEELKNTFGTKRDKVTEAAKKDFINNKAVFVSESDVTKQRVTFAYKKITKAQREEAGEGIGYDIAQIVNAGKNNYYPKTGGVRFPNNKCTLCAMRGICADIPALRDALVVRDQGTDFDVIGDE